MAKKQNRTKQPAAASVPTTPAQGRRQPAAAAVTPSISWKLARPVLLLAVVLFVGICLTVSNYIKGITLAMTLGGILILLTCTPTLRKRLTLPAAVLTLMVFVDGLSTLYAVSGKFALNEFAKVQIAFCLFIIILAFERGSGAEMGRRTATILETFGALAGLISIDLISTRLLSSPFLWLLGRFTNSYATLPGVEVGVRMTSLFDNPNIFAGCVGIGVLLSLGLATTARASNERRYHLVCLALNALSFVLAFSMGASGVILLAFLAYLALERGQRRAHLFVLMVETLLVTVIAVFPIYVTAFEAWDGIQPVPVLCAVASAAALCWLDKAVGQRAAAKLTEHGKLVVACILGAMGLMAVFAVLALNLTGGVSLQAGEWLRRSAYPEAGSYTLQLQADGDMNVTIESQNRQETMMHTSTIIYHGAAKDAPFTVPEDSMVVYFNFKASQDTQLDGASYEGETESQSLKLGYKLLPGFIANRLQGLFANQNAIQRTVFFEDGMKLFQRSPIFGLGMGAFENAYTSVQSFHYITKYTHNHYIQALLETGVIGLLLFAGSLLTCAVAIWKSRKQGEAAHPLTAALGAALIFMAGHAGVEVVFSSYFYLPIAFGVFALISLCCAKPLAVVTDRPKAQVWTLRGISALMAVFALLLSGNLLAQTLPPDYGNISMAIQLDRYEWTDHMLTYVYNVTNAEEGDVSAQVAEKAEGYAKRLEKVNSNIIPLYLADYYFKNDRLDEAFAMIEQYVTYVSSNPATWQSAFHMVMEYVRDDASYKAGVVKVAQMLQEWNQKNMGTITLDATTTKFIEIMSRQ